MQKYTKLFFSVAANLHHRIITNNEVHNYNTQELLRLNYRPHACRTNLKQFTILFQGPKIWNALPLHVKDLSSFLL